jgi:hypothetical protein
MAEIDRERGMLGDPVTKNKSKEVVKSTWYYSLKQPQVDVVTKQGIENTTLQ